MGKCIIEAPDIESLTQEIADLIEGHSAIWLGGPEPLQKELRMKREGRKEMAAQIVYELRHCLILKIKPS